MIVNTDQRRLITALTGVFGGNPKQALETVELLDPKAISQIDIQAGFGDLKVKQSLEIISKGGFANPQAFASRGRVGVLVESEGAPQLAEIFADDHKIGAIVIQILQGTLTKPEDVQSKVEALFEDKHKADLAKLFKFLLNRAR